MMPPKVGIIYLTYPTPEWERDIFRALISLETMYYPKERVELICVESKGAGGPVKPWFDEYWMPKSGKELPHITYILKDELTGFSGNNNLGFEVARELGCNYVYLLNEDTEVDPDFLGRAVERAQSDPKIAFVQSLILLGSSKNLVNTIGNAYHFLGFGYSFGYLWTRERAEQFFVQQRKEHPDLQIGYASGAGVLGRVSAIEVCGGLFDERFFSYHEDTDASLQARMRGYKVVVEPASVIYHYYQFAKNHINYYWMERNRYVLVWSYYRFWTLGLLLPMMIVMDMGVLIFSFVHGWWREKLRVYRDWITLDYWRWIRERRRAIQSARCISDREFLRFAVSTIDFQEAGVHHPLLVYLANPLMWLYWRIVRMLLV